MICARHGLIATNTEYGIAYCLRCFVEARKFADEMTLDRVVRRLRGGRT